MTHRLRPPRLRWKVLKTAAPSRNATTDVVDFAHACRGAPTGRLEMPSAAKTVLPVYSIISSPPRGLVDGYVIPAC